MMSDIEELLKPVASDDELLREAERHHKTDAQRFPPGTSAAPVRDQLEAVSPGIAPVAAGSGIGMDKPTERLIVPDISEPSSDRRIHDLAEAVATLQSTVFELLPRPAGPASVSTGLDLSGDIDDLMRDPTENASAVQPELLGEYSSLLEQKDEPLGEPVSDKLADIINKLTGAHQKEKSLKEKLEAHPRPSNCSALVPTRVNSEVWNVLKSSTRNSDYKLHGFQKLILAAISPLKRVVHDLLSSTSSPAGFSRADSIKRLLDSVAILGAANQDLNKRRRDLIKPELNSAFRSLCSESATTSRPFSPLLFGDDLPKRCKELQDTHRLGLSARDDRSGRSGGKGVTSSHQRQSPRFHPYFKRGLNFNNRRTTNDARQSRRASDRPARDSWPARAPLSGRKDSQGQQQPR